MAVLAIEARLKGYGSRRKRLCSIAIGTKLFPTIVQLYSSLF